MQLLFNPTGLVRSLQRGVTDMIEMPLQGLQKGSASEFLSGIGYGSASLVREISGKDDTKYGCCHLAFLSYLSEGVHAEWSVSSVMGFSRAASNAVAGSRLVSALGRRRTSSIELPLDMEAGSPAYSLKTLSGSIRLLQSLPGALQQGIGSVLLIVPAEEVTVTQDPENSSEISSGTYKLGTVLAILTTTSLYLYTEGGLTPSFIAWLDDASIMQDPAVGSIHINSRAAPFNAFTSIWRASISLTFPPIIFSSMLPCLRNYANRLH